MPEFSEDHAIPGIHAVHLAQICERFGVRSLLAASGLDEDELTQPGARLSIRELVALVERARALTGECITRMVRGENDPGLAAMTKNAATDMLTFVAYEATQIHGGHGYMRETLVERLSRDARLYPIGGGTREIMNEIIARTEGY